MSGVGLVLNTAKGALSAQQIGLATVGHNIANVSTANYSRQSIQFSANDPIPFGTIRMGNGVATQKISRSCDQMLENRVMAQQSTLSALEQEEASLQIMEALFNEGSDSSTSAMISDFWNAWHTLSDNPAGASERIGLADGAKRVVDVLNYLNNELDQLDTKLSRSLDDGLGRVNEVSKQIALMNNAISGLEKTTTANDERDKRNSMVNELSSLIGIGSFEQLDGSLTVTTGNGYTIINSADSFNLTRVDEGIMWQGSFGGQVNITDKITGGKIGGWIELKEEVIPKFKNDLDNLAKGLIWSVNKEHSQGIGLDYFSAPVKGTYSTDSSGLLSTLKFGDKIDYNKDFKMWFQDTSMTTPAYSSMNVDMGISNAQISNWTGKGSSNNTYNFTVVNGGVADSKADPGDPAIYWEKINNLTGKKTGSGVINITDTNTFVVDDSVSAVSPLSFDISAGKLVAGNTFSINTDEDGAAIPLDLSASGQANSVLDTYKFKVTKNDGLIGKDEIYIEWQNSINTGEIRLKNDTPTPISTYVDGMKFEFNSGNIFENDEFTVSTDKNGIPTTNLTKDWHWTLNSFKDQFNRQSFGAKASNASNCLKIIPSNDACIINNYQYSDDIDGSVGNSFTDVNTKIKVLNYKSLTQENPQFNFSRTDEGIWSISNNGGYTSAKIIPKPLDFVPDNTSQNTSNSQDSYKFTVATGGTIGTDTVVINWQNSTGAVTGTITLDPAAAPFTAIDVDGMDVDFNSGLLRNGDEFTIVTDSTGHPSVESVPNDTGFGVDLDGDSISDLLVDFSNPVTKGGWLEFDIEKNSAQYSFGFSDNNFDDSGIAAALGINTFFDGFDANSIKLNSILSDSNNIAAGKIQTAENNPVTSDHSIILPITIDGSNNTIEFKEGQSKTLTATISPTLSGGEYTTDSDLDILAANIESALESASMYGIDYKVSYDSTEKKLIIDQEQGKNIETKFLWNNSAGAASALGFDAIENTYTPADRTKDGQFGTSDNSNALAISNMQYENQSITQWTFKRGEDPKSVAVETTLEGYYQTMIGSLGVKSASVTRGRDFNESMISKLTEQRDSISAVSLDEEMINMMKFQQAYQAAAKLLTTADQMLEALINSR